MNIKTLSKNPQTSRASNFYTLEDQEDLFGSVFHSFTNGFNSLFGGPKPCSSHHYCPHCNQEILPNDEQEVNIGDGFGNLYLHKKCFKIQKELAKEEVKRVKKSIAAADGKSAVDNDEGRHVAAFVYKIKKNLSTLSQCSSNSGFSSRYRSFNIRTGLKPQEKPTLKLSDDNKLTVKDHPSSSKGVRAVEPMRIIQSPEFECDVSSVASIYNEVPIQDVEKEDYYSEEESPPLPGMIQLDDSAFTRNANRSIVTTDHHHDHPLSGSPGIKRVDSASSSKSGSRSILKSDLPPESPSATVLESPLLNISNYIDNLFGEAKPQCKRCQQNIQSHEGRVDLIFRGEKVPYHESCFEIERILDREKLQILVEKERLEQAKKDAIARAERKKTKKAKKHESVPLVETIHITTSSEGPESENMIEVQSVASKSENYESKEVDKVEKVMKSEEKKRKKHRFGRKILGIGRARGKNKNDTDKAKVKGRKSQDKETERIQSTKFEKSTIEVEAISKQGENKKNKSHKNNPIKNKLRLWGSKGKLGRKVGCT